MAGDWIDELVDASLARGHIVADESGRRSYTVIPRQMISLVHDDPWTEDHRGCSICRGQFDPE